MFDKVFVMCDELEVRTQPQQNVQWRTCWPLLGLRGQAACSGQCRAGQCSAWQWVAQLPTCSRHTHVPTCPRPAKLPPQAVRQNRLALLRDLAALPAGILDLAELPGF